MAAAIGTLCLLFQYHIQATKGLSSEDISNPSLASKGYRSLSNKWTGSTDALPSPRTFATICAAGSNLFLFGGQSHQPQPDGSIYLNDLYMFETTRGAWSDELTDEVCCKDNDKVDVYGIRPPPRAQHTATYHTGSKRMFIFGGITDRNGFNGEPLSQYRYSAYGGGSDIPAGFSNDAQSTVPQYLNDMHFLDTDFSKHTLMRWSGKLTTIGTGPAPRASHAMVEHGDSLYVFGGRSGSRLFNDMYKFDVTTFAWSVVRAAGGANTPSPRHFFGSCATSSHFYVYGGLWEKYPDEVLPLATSDSSFQVPVSEPGIGGVETKLHNQSSSSENIIIPLDGLYAFSFENYEWVKLASGQNRIELGRMPSPRTNQQLPRPRYGTHLVPVVGSKGSSSSATSALSLMLIGGLDGDAGVSADEVSVYNIVDDRWELNVMTGLSDIDSASTVRGSVGSGVPQWRGESPHQHVFSSRRSNDGVVNEYDRDEESHPAEGAVMHSYEMNNAAMPKRASPSPFASRPQPRIGLCWTVYQDRMWEFGGQKLLRTLGGKIRYADMVNELNVYVSSSQPGWVGRPHGQGANITPNMQTQKDDRSNNYLSTSRGNYLVFGNGPYSSDATRNPVKLSKNDLVVSPQNFYVFENSIQPSSVYSNQF